MEKAPDSDAHVLGKYTEIVSKHGPESKEAQAFREQYKDKPELFDLCGFSNTVRQALRLKIS